MVFKEEYVKKIKANGPLMTRWAAEIGVDKQTIKNRLKEQHLHKKLMSRVSLDFITKEMGVSESEIVEQESMPA